MRLFSAFLQLTICLTAVGQTFEKGQKKLTFYPYVYVDTESKYVSSNGEFIIIQNSLPKGAGYNDPGGRNFGGRTFWTRIINETSSPLELTISFPADSFTAASSSEPYLKLFLLQDTMTLDKEGMYAYGAERAFKSYVETGNNKPTILQRNINPKEAYMFYVGVLFLGEREGVARAGFVLKEKELFYRMNLLGSELIHCGQLVFKK